MPFPLATLAPTIDAAGITTPPYADILASLQASFRLIYGADAYLEPDSQDGQLLAIFAQAQHDANQAIVAAYNNWSPSTAQGAGLSSVVKVNGIARLVPSASQVNVTLTGVAGTSITLGKVADQAGNLWALPSLVTIPGPGTITVTATAVEAGAIVAPIGTVTVINTPTSGWQTVTNATAATAGAPVESDAALRSRQAASTQLPALTVLGAISAGVAALTGVTALKAYENDTNTTDANGLPPHSISLVVTGGNATDIATVMLRRKTPGAYTHGSTSIFVTDSVGVSHQMRFYVTAPVAVKIALTVTALPGYTSATGDLIKQALADYVNGLEIGEQVVVARLYVPAQLARGTDNAAAVQYKLTALTAGLLAGALGSTDVPVLFNERAALLVANVTLTVV